MSGYRSTTLPWFVTWRAACCAASCGWMITIVRVPTL
jgi:hypothetical protein